MNNETQDTKIIPTRRTAETYRAVLQQWEPEKNRYRIIASARIESGQEPAAVAADWSAAIQRMAATGSGPATAREAQADRPDGPDRDADDDQPHPEGEPLGSGLNLDPDI